MPNYDEKTGIHYGVISPNSISSEVLSELCDKSTDTVYESAKDDLLRDFTVFCDNHNIDVSCIDTDQIIDGFNQRYYNDYHGYEYENKEYTLQICDDNFGIFVIRSPYYTYTKQCSPCALGAGDLDNSISKEEYEKGNHNAFMYGTVKAYCLPSDFFDSQYRKIPYRYYNVSDDKECIADIIEVN